MRVLSESYSSYPIREQFSEDSSSHDTIANDRLREMWKPSPRCDTQSRRLGIHGTRYRVSNPKYKMVGWLNGCEEYTGWIAQWLRNTMVGQLNGWGIHWLDSSMVEEYSGGIAQWLRNAMVGQPNDCVIQWLGSSIVAWGIQWFGSSMVEEHNGSVARWLRNTMVGQLNGCCKYNGWVVQWLRNTMVG